MFPISKSYRISQCTDIAASLRLSGSTRQLGGCFLYVIFQTLVSKMPRQARDRTPKLYYHTYDWLERDLRGATRFHENPIAPRCILPLQTPVWSGSIHMNVSRSCDDLLHMMYLCSLRSASQFWRNQLPFRLSYCTSSYSLMKWFHSFLLGIFHEHAPRCVFICSCSSCFSHQYHTYIPGMILESKTTCAQVSRSHSPEHLVPAL